MIQNYIDCVIVLIKYINFIRITIQSVFFFNNDSALNKKRWLVETLGIWADKSIIDFEEIRIKWITAIVWSSRYLSDIQCVTIFDFGIMWTAMKSDNLLQKHFRLFIETLKSSISLLNQMFIVFWPLQLNQIDEMQWDKAIQLFFLAKRNIFWIKSSLF